MRTATAIVKAAWAQCSFSVPPLLLRKFKKALLDYGDVPQRRALLSLVHAVAVGDIKIEYKPDDAVQSAHRAPDTRSGVLEDARVLLVSADGRVLNPTPFSNKLLD